MEEDILDYTDLVLLYSKKFEYEVFGTLWGTDKDRTEWCVLPEALGGFLLFHQRLPNGSLSPRRTMTREEFTEIFG